MDISLGSEAITGTAAILTSLGVLYGSFIQIRKRIIRPVRSWLDKLDKVCETLGPNGGSSLYDKLTAIDRRTVITEARGAALTDAMGVAEWQSGINGECLSISRAACRRTQRAESEFLGYNWRNVVHPDDSERVAEEWHNAVKEGRIFTMRYRWTTDSGTAIPIRATATPMRSGGVLIGWIASVVFEEDEGK